MKNMHVLLNDEEMEKLKKIKNEGNMRNLNEVVVYLINYYEEHQKTSVAEKSKE
jgi:hypothetical protein